MSRAPDPIDGFGGNLDSAFDAAPVPAGWVMVPREPTEAMVLAASMAWDASKAGMYDSFAAALRGGIQAAPGSADHD